MLLSENHDAIYANLCKRAAETRQSLLVLVADDADALCAARILTVTHLMAAKSPGMTRMIDAAARRFRAAQGDSCFRIF